jgi:hypothetical protein
MQTDFTGHFEISKDSNLNLYTSYAEVLCDFSRCHRAIFEAGNNSLLPNLYLVANDYFSTSFHQHS